MKQAYTVPSHPRDVAAGVERTEHGPLRALSTAALLCLAGCSTKESISSHAKAPSTDPAAPLGALAAPTVAVSADLPHVSLSDRLRHLQDRTHTRPTDLSFEEACRVVRGLIDDAVRDTQSLEKPIGHLRAGYTTNPSEVAEQRSIIEAAARHSNRSVEETIKIIEECHRGYLDTFDITTSISTLKERLGLDAYRRMRGELEEVVCDAREEIEQATVRANLDKIDRSLELFRELRALLQARDDGAEHDAKRLKNLSRMCSAHTLRDVNEIIPQLELLRTRNAEGDFNQTLRQGGERIRNAEEKIRALDEGMELRWCENYEQMTLMERKVASLEAQLVEAGKAAKRYLPKELGELVPSDKHVELKADLAEIKLRDSRLAVYSLKDTAGELVARIFDTGREFDTDGDVRYVRVAIDEPSTSISLKRGADGMRIEGPASSSFDKAVLDVKETARSEVVNTFKPTLLQHDAVNDVRLPAKKVVLSLRMNPGCAFDMREVFGASTLEVTLRGSGVVRIGREVPGESSVRVKVEGEETMKGGSPLVISAPEGISLEDIRCSAESESNYTVGIGNVTFEQLGFRREGRGHDVDVAIRTSRGVERLPIVRNGAYVARRAP